MFPARSGPRSLGTNSQIGYDSSNLTQGIDLKLGALANTGGPTETREPIYDPGNSIVSPLIDVIPDMPYTIPDDQRGMNRESATLGTPSWPTSAPWRCPRLRRSSSNEGMVQRSRLYQIEIHFENPVAVSALTATGAFTLTRTHRTRSQSASVVGTVVENGATGANDRIIIAPVSGRILYGNRFDTTL